jgi:hypothetical protein
MPSRLTFVITHSAAGPTAALGPEIPLTGNSSVGVATKILPSILVMLIDAFTGLRVVTRIQRQCRRIGAEMSDSFDQFDGRTRRACFGCDGNGAE